MTDIIGHGGKGGGGHTPVEADDTLSSKQTMRLLFALSEGEIEAIDDILINSASISNYSSSITYDWRAGTSDQTVIKGFSEVEAPISGAGSFPVQLNHAVNHTYSLLGAYDAARVTLMIDRLMQVTDQGDRVGYEATVLVYKRHQPAGGSPSTWQLVYSTAKKGKCTNPYAWDIRVQKPDATLSSDTWGIMVVRDSADDADDKHYSDTYLSAITTITEASLPYPKTALVGVTITDAKQFGGQIPEVKFKIKGLKMPLPTNYDPVTRIYDETSPWDGSFKAYNEYTNNLAWAIYWILRDATLGLGIAAADLDLGSFYTFAKYCDEMVSNGQGGTEPRYTINAQFIERSSVPQFLTYLTTLGNANFATNELGQIEIVYDHPAQAVSKVITNANVVDGVFRYSSSDLESRTSLVNVTYMREELLGDSDTATHYDDTLIDRYGLQTSDVILFGCTSESQALRKARWALYNNSYTTQIISFSQLFQGATYYVGEVVSIMDSDNVTTAVKHAVVTASAYGANTTLTLDREITLGAYVYTVEFIGSDGTTVYSETIGQSDGTFNEVTIAGNTPAYVGGSIIFSSSALEPRLAKVIKIDKDDNHVYTISCVEHQEAKYTYIDNIGTITPPSTSGSYVNFNDYLIPAVTTLAVQQVYSTNGVVEFNKLTASWIWTAPVGSKPFVPTFDISWRRDNQEFTRIRGLQVATFDIEYPVPGVYDIYVWAVNPFTGLKSEVTYLQYNYRVTTATSTLLPPTSVVVPNTAGVSFSGRNLVLAWNYNAANDAVKDAIRDYVVEVLTSANVLKGSYTVPLRADKGGEFTLSFDENVAIFGTATRSFNVRVYSRDTIGDLSNYIAVSPSNPAPVVTTFAATAVFSAAYLKAEIPTDTDLVSYLFKQYAAASGGSPLNQISTVSNYVDFDATSGTTYYYTVTPYDVYGAGTETTRQSVAALSVSADTYTYTGLLFNPNNPSTNNVSWTSFVATKNGTESTTVSSGSAAWSSGILYLYYVNGDTTLNSTTSLATAVSGRILASYRGGTDLTSDEGRAYIDGDTVIAGTIGANQLVVGSAVITQAAQIGNILQSDNYSWSGTYAGWRLDKTGTLYAQSIDLRNSSGGVIFQAGSGFNWNNVTGTNVPAANATQNSSLSGSGTPSAGLGTTGASYFDTSTGLMWWKGASGWSKVIPQISSANVDTFIASTAIGQAQIGNLAVGTGQIKNLAVTTAKIEDLQVTTLKIGIDAVTVTAFGELAPTDIAVTGSSGTWTNLVTYNVPANAQGYPTMVDVSDSGITSSGTLMSYKMLKNVRITDGGGVVLKSYSAVSALQSRYRFLITSAPTIIKIDYQFYSYSDAQSLGYPPGTTVTLNEFTASSTTVKR